MERKRMRHRVLPVLLCLCLLFSAIGALVAAEETVMTGTVHVNDSLRVRSGPGTSYAMVGSLYDNDVVTITETVENSSGKWYKVTKGTLTGYSSADYITINAKYDPDEDFEAYMTAQGFPESYKPGLRQIHAEHPQWVLRAQKLSMSFDTAWKAECRVGLNTLQSPDAWKSMEYGAYDFAKNQYVSFDNGGYVSAAAPVIAYYLDPRPWLNSRDVFQFEELSYSAEHTADGVRAILPKLLQKYTDDFMRAAKESNVSAYYLAAKAAQEGTDKNKLGTGEVPGYEGYYNFFDIGAVKGNGNSAVINGAIYAKNRGWDTPYKCLIGSANMIGQYYIQRGQDTVYYQKFNVTNKQSGLYGHQYMTYVAGAKQEGALRYSRTSSAQLACALTFIIPVYTSIPESIPSEPSRTGNNDNFLNEITVDKLSLTPTFDRYTHEYAVQVDASVTRVTVAAKKHAAGATLTGGGEIILQPGENTVALTVTATSGAKRTYTVTITREGGEAIKTPTITGKTYRVGETITGVEPGTAATAFLQALAVADGKAVLTDSAGKAKTGGSVACGDIVRLYSKNDVLCASYPVVIVGDVNGDGAVNSVDLLRAQKHILGLEELAGPYLTAADSNRDGKVDSVDLLRTQKYILKLLESLQ